MIPENIERPFKVGDVVLACWYTSETDGILERESTIGIVIRQDYADSSFRVFVLVGSDPYSTFGEVLMYYPRHMSHSLVEKS